MKSSVLQVHPDDTVLVALCDLPKGSKIFWEAATCQVRELIPVKHKFSIIHHDPGDEVIMYGVVIGKATQKIKAGDRITRENVQHATSHEQAVPGKAVWGAPDTKRFEGRTFLGYHREDGKVGTRNYWLVFPLVFCENRNVKVLEDSLLTQLGYNTRTQHSLNIQPLIQKYQSGAETQDILAVNLIEQSPGPPPNRFFSNVDGIKFLKHQGGCGGSPQDSETLCRLLAGYINNPNVAGATVLSLGCQHAQMELMQQSLDAFDVSGKPVIMLEQQQHPSEREFLEEAIRQTFAGLMQANTCQRKPASLSKLVLGLECGGSDGFSGITANPALGYTSDLLVAIGGTSILSEFPELNGVEQDLIRRSVDQQTADKFRKLMDAYSDHAAAVGSGFDLNPSPGNIRDGLITDAMKSAGAARKGGTSPVTDVLDYTEQATKSGLNLLCTPGNDVESTTGLAGSGANMIVFTTGLGTPTGNPIAPTIKFSTNTMLYNRMRDLIDLDAGTIVGGEDTLASKGEELLELIIRVASGEVWTQAERLCQDDFIPWKRGVSL